MRTRDNVVHGMYKIDDVVEILNQEKTSRSLKSVFKKKTEVEEK